MPQYKGDYADLPGYVRPKAWHHVMTRSYFRFSDDTAWKWLCLCGATFSADTEQKVLDQHCSLPPVVDADL